MFAMITSVQITSGFIIGLTGLFRIADSPIPAGGALLAGGLLILEGMDRIWKR